MDEAGTNARIIIGTSTRARGRLERMNTGHSQERGKGGKYEYKGGGDGNKNLAGRVDTNRD